MSSPTVHGLTDYWLGGCSNRHADRAQARAIEARFPGVPGMAVAAQEFRLRAARLLAAAGITRFIRAGALAAVPGRNVHDAAREVQPGARAVYVTRDADAHALSRALLPGPGAVVALADVTDPAEFLAAPAVAAMLAEGEPVALMLAAVPGFLPEGEAKEYVAACAEALPAGSALAVSAASADDSADGRELAAMFTPARIRPLPAAEVESWLDGLDVDPPGVADVRLLAGGGGTVLLPGQTAPSRSLGAVAWKR